MLKVIINENDSGRTLHKFLRKNLPNYRLSFIYNLISSGSIRINDRKVKNKNYQLQNNDVLILQGIDSFSPQKRPIAFKWNFKILFEDNNLLIVVKRHNLKMHDDNNSLDAEVERYFKDKGEENVLFSSINRLDKWASGIVVYAKNYKATKFFKDNVRKIRKIYALKSDFLKPFETNYYIYHSEKVQKMIGSNSDRKGKKSHTKFWIDQKTFQQYAEISTGYKHQIRVSASKSGFPIHGDLKYGGVKKWRLFLHLEKVIFPKIEGEFSYLSGANFKILPSWKTK